jgi:hypothetical protein
VLLPSFEWSLYLGLFEIDGRKKKRERERERERERDRETACTSMLFEPGWTKAGTVPRRGGPGPPTLRRVSEPALNVPVPAEVEISY